MKMKIAVAAEKLTRFHYAYFGITGNYRALNRFLYRVTRVGRYCLSRRSQRASISWDKVVSVMQHCALPRPRIRPAPVT